MCIRISISEVMCDFLHVWSHLPWKPCFISFDVLLVSSSFRRCGFPSTFFFICLKLCFHVSGFLQEKKDPNRGASGFNFTSWNCAIQGTETSWPWTQVENDWTGHLKCRTHCGLTWISGSMVGSGLSKDWAFQFFKRKISATKSMDDISVRCNNAPKKIQQKPPRYQPARSEARHHHHHGIHTCSQKDKGPFNLPNIG